jgi:hypothetical protein
MSIETELKGDRTYKGACVIGEDPFTGVITMKGTGQKSVPIKKLEPEFMGTGAFKMSADLKTYDLQVGILTNVKTSEVTQTHKNLKSCGDGHAYTSTKSDTVVSEYRFTLDLNGNPLPAAVGVVTGSKKMPLAIGGKSLDATVSWTLTPIR